MAGKARREKGTGSIFRRGEGYVAQVLDGYKDDGKPRYRQVRTKTQAEAAKVLNDYNARVAAGVPIPEGKVLRLGKWLDVWLEDHVRPNREPKTYAYYRLQVEARLKPHLGSLDVRRIRAADMARAFRLMEEEGASKGTLLAARRTLRAALNVAVKNDLCADNPVVKTYAPKVPRTKKVYFDAEQAQALLTALKGSPIENLVMFTLATGVRVGEACGATWANVDLPRKSVLIESQLQRVGGELRLKPLKTDKSVRTMPLVGHSLEAVQAEQTRQAVEGWENPLGLVFLNAQGRPMDPKSVNERLHAALKAAGLPMTGMHSLRHSAATFMLMAGLNLHQVSRYLGHSQIALTSNLYGHVLDGAMREAAEALQSAYKEG